MREREEAEDSQALSIGNTAFRLSFEQLSCLSPHFSPGREMQANILTKPAGAVSPLRAGSAAPTGAPLGGAGGPGPAAGTPAGPGRGRYRCRYRCRYREPVTGAGRARGSNARPGPRPRGSGRAPGACPPGGQNSAPGVGTVIPAHRARVPCAVGVLNVPMGS